ncbi:phytoene synthase [Corynebacterium suranareeae]|uniref:Phytoene synthase n=2 Tax=Corynebacterium suranareeae TaxID=2506452 RepID=A0A160PTY0_9CORY|nr:phytoene/squalene synthase family protein [Corynebacterium suranareeae]BAU96773.1 phytoene synthase [Corynebacterium suranareeae]
MADQRDFLGRFDAMSSKATATVIAHYSTSFTLASRLLSPKTRHDIEALYGMVRVADEIVDGAAAAAGCTPEAVAEILDNYEHQVLLSLDTPFHTDPVIHAFGNTARKCGFEKAHIVAFFNSMRRDLSQTTYDPTQLDEYIYGSAEVIGLMCLKIFLQDSKASAKDREAMEHGARRLGAAFQKVNFLRDLAEDKEDLGRSYLPVFTESMRDEIVLDIRADLDAARLSIPLLPFGARAGVRAATDLYGCLVDNLESASLEDLKNGRISVAKTKKASLATKAMWKEVFRK